MSRNNNYSVWSDDVDRELIKYVERLASESRGCLGEKDIELLVDCSVTGEGDIEVSVAGVRSRIPCWHLPETWANLLHVTCSRDYEKMPAFVPQRGWFVLDAGAYLGFYTVLAAQRVGEEGLIVAVEPLEINRRVLEENVAINGFIERVRIDPRALADEYSVRVIHVSCYPATSSIFRRHVEYHGEVCGTRKVVTVPLAGLLDDHGLESVDLVKLDVEGAEGLILETSGWEERVKRLVVEVHTDMVPVERLQVLLEERGFETRAYYVSDSQVVLYAW